MDEETKLRAISWHKIKHRTDILKVYKQKAIKYGTYLEISEYQTVRVTRKNTRLVYTRSLTGKKASRSLQRTRGMVYKITEANVNQHGPYAPVFFTLTYKENVTDLRQSNELFKAFIRRLNIHIRNRIRYIVVPEFQERGAVHYHGIFFNLPFIPVLTFKRLWSHGSIDIQASNSIRSAGRYIAKYITSDIHDVRYYGNKCYFTSRNLIRPIHIYNDLDIDNYKRHGKLILRDIFVSQTLIKSDYKICQPVNSSFS